MNTTIISVVTCCLFIASASMAIFANEFSTNGRVVASLPIAVLENNLVREGKLNCVDAPGFEYERKFYLDYPSLTHVLTVDGSCNLVRSELRHKSSGKLAGPTKRASFDDMNRKIEEICIGENHLPMGCMGKNEDIFRVTWIYDLLDNTLLKSWFSEVGNSKARTEAVCRVDENFSGIAEPLSHNVDIAEGWICDYSEFK